MFSLKKKATPLKQNLKLVADAGKLTRNTNKKKKPVVLQAYKTPLYDKCYRRVRFFIKNVG